MAINAQMITTPQGERLVLIPEAEYLALIEAREDAEDVVAVRDFRRKLTSAEEELLPSTFVDRILAGESAIRVWREHRGLTSAALAAKAGIGQGFLSQIETGKRDGGIDTLKKLAAALDVTLNDLVG